MKKMLKKLKKEIKGSGQRLAKAALNEVQHRGRPLVKKPTAKQRKDEAKKNRSRRVAFKQKKRQPKAAPLQIVEEDGEVLTVDDIAEDMHDDPKFWAGELGEPDLEEDIYDDPRYHAERYIKRELKKKKREKK